MSEAFIYCPQCGSPSVEGADYDDEENGVYCLDCSWEGDSSELVSKE